MEKDKVFYLLLLQQTSNEARLNRLVVFYSTENWEPVIAYRLTPTMSAPKSYRMLDMITITKNYYFSKCKELESMGLLLPYGRAIQEGT